MGGSVSVNVPLSSTQLAHLNSEYTKRSGEGKDDDTLKTELNESIASIIVFNQIDCDHDGTLSAREIRRLLRALPNKKPLPPPEGWPDGVSPPFIPVDKIMEILDSDNDGVVSLEEFVLNMKNIPALKASIDQNLDPVTGKITTYKSLEQRLDEHLTLSALLESKVAEGGGDLASLSDEERATLEGLRKIIEDYQLSVGTTGITLFKQIDADKSGKVDKSELVALLKSLILIKKEDGTVADWLELDTIIAAFDSDGDGLIDEDEWIMHLNRLPALNSFLSAHVDHRTGKIREVSG